MTDLSSLFWQAPLDDIKKGYIYNENTDEFICLICGKSFANGMIYSCDDGLYEAKKYIKVHINDCHKSTFHFLLNLDKKLTGLTEHQKTLLELFYNGNNDSEIAKALNIGSTSTVRNHRFNLKEKMKQAKVFLALMELLNEQLPDKQSFIDIPRSSKKVDDRFAITEEENKKILKTYFKEGLNGPLASFPLKEKRRVTILRHLITFFDANSTYKEKEVNLVLKRFYSDYALLRRLLIEYGFMERTQDGSSYWIKL